MYQVPDRPALICKHIAFVQECNVLTLAKVPEMDFLLGTQILENQYNNESRHHMSTGKQV